MVGRITYKNFLMYFIDYFELDEIKSFYYLLISAAIPNERLNENVVKVWDLYPSSELVMMLDDSNGNIIIDESRYENFKKEYFKELDESKNVIYKSILSPILHHNSNFMIVSSEKESMIIDALCEYLKKKFKLPIINLDELFEKGETDVFYIDKHKMHNAAVSLAREVSHNQVEGLKKTEEGRKRLLTKMNEKELRRLLKELDIRVSKNTSMSELIKLANENWVYNEDSY